MENLNGYNVTRGRARTLVGKSQRGAGGDRIPQTQPDSQFFLIAALPITTLWVSNKMIFGNLIFSMLNKFHVGDIPCNMASVLVCRKKRH